MSVVSASTDREPRWGFDLRPVLSGVAVMILLLWPALLNRYPLVFSDTGTYLSQIVERHLGWDRPIFYSLLILPLHLTLTTWPVIVAQAIVTWFVLHVVIHAFTGNVRRLPGMILVLSATTALPWITSQVMPDFTTGLLTLLVVALVMVPERLGRRRAWSLALLLTALIATHQANVPIASLLLLVLLPLRRPLGAAQKLGGEGALRAVLPVLLATLAMTAVNVIGHGRLSPSPYGNVFVLARSLADGPAMDALRRHCPHPGWRLCALVREGQPRDPDVFLWSPDSVLYRVGGPKVIAAEADGILVSAFRDEPLRMIGDALRDMAHQLVMLRTGDGLTAWPLTVSPVMARDFPPAEWRRYQGAVQQSQGELLVPAWLQVVHIVAFVLGAVATPAWLVWAWRQRPIAGLCVATLVCLLGNAAITGALSGPHDRYQSRVAWLAVFTPMVAARAFARRSGASLNPSPGRMPAHAAARSAS